MKKIGFIGLGKMGMPMALNLCRKGFDVQVCSSNPDSQKKILESGGYAASSFAEMAGSCDAVVTIVPSDKEILELFEGDDGILANAREGLVWIEMTSAKGTTKEAVAEAIRQSGKQIDFLDAPVSGGVAGAEKGTLTIMVGSGEKELEENRNILEAMGSKIIHTGPVGSGSNVKMLNQMLNAANTAVAAEVLCISRMLGVDDHVLSEVVNQSSGGSYIFERNVPKYMMTGDHTPGFRLNLMKKDVGLFIDTAQEIDGFAPLSNIIYQMYKAAAHQGMGDQNYTAVHTWYENNQEKERNL